MRLIPYLKNSIRPALIVLIISLGLPFITSCSRRAPVAETDLEKKFAESFNKTTKLDYQLYTSTKISGKTLWIYIATEKELLAINSSPATGGVTPDKNVKFLDINCLYESSSFDINYIFLKYSPEEKTRERDVFRKAVGGTTLYQDFTRQAIEMLQKTYYAIGDIISDTKDINFFVICLANIKDGIKITFVIHRLDMEQFLLNMLPSDEFYNRMLLKADGGKDIINDKYGLHIQYNDISLVDFLREQIVSNVRSKISEMEKFKTEELKSLDNLDEILLRSVYEVTTKYQFEDFAFVEINNIITKDKLLFSRTKLMNKFGAKLLPAYTEEYDLSLDKYNN
ncbi:MAG: hypothetical protein PHG69_02450 [Candidatus Omnitrophica bacterium]|nr:hypothetical protein [Candidatus Omnitrophota bacterium]